jgi:hypothetical protein
MTNTTKQKYPQVTELDNIKIGPATSFNAKNENDVVVLNIFPEGNDNTTSDEPYYISCRHRGLRYFSRDLFRHTNTTPIKINEPTPFKL